MPPIRLREGLAFPRKSQSFPEADGRHTILFKVRQDWQCIFHAFLLGAGQITHALPLGAGRHGFSCPLDAGRHGFSCTSPCFQFIMEDWHCPDNLKNNGTADTGGAKKSHCFRHFILLNTHRVIPRVPVFILSFFWISKMGFTVQN